MRGIDEETLIAVRKSLAAEKLNTDVIDALISLKIRELQEPWIPLEEFLKSGFEGWCWVNTAHDVIISYFETGVFYSNDLGSAEEIYQPELNITHVQPIHKPEPPKL